MDKMSAKQLKDENPVRKSGRVRHAVVSGGNFCSYAGLAGGSVYCENYKEFDRFLYNNDNEFLMSITQKERGTRRKKKGKRKFKDSESSQ